MKSENLETLERQGHPIRVITANGMLGELSTAERRQKNGKDVYLVVFGPDQKVWIDPRDLEQRSDGTLYLPITISADAQSGELAKDLNETFPVIEERVNVDRRKVETGKVRIRKHVTEHTEVVDEPGFEEEVEVERVLVDQVVDQPVTIRQEGDTTIIPIMEEILVVEKRLVLKEEVRVTKRRKVTHHPQEVSLQREEVQIERGEPGEEKDPG